MPVKCFSVFVRAACAPELELRFWRRNFERRKPRGPGRRVEISVQQGRLVLKTNSQTHISLLLRSLHFSFGEFISLQLKEIRRSRLFSALKAL